jgi:CheY-like chemotaxis protein
MNQQHFGRSMTGNRDRQPVILVIDDIEETRYGTERLLAATGYQVSTARDEEEAALKAGFQPPDLVLISLGLNAFQVPSNATRIRRSVGLGEEIPIVFFCVTSLDEGAEVEAGHNAYMTRPDNFDQLRALLRRLVRKPQAG